MSNLVFPGHKCSLTLSHNPHKDVYDTIEVYIERLCGEWVSEEEKVKALETNDFWMLQWYPNTPICFFLLYAHNLDKLLEESFKVKKEYT